MHKIFEVDDAVRSLGLKGSYFLINGMRNAETHPEFAELSLSVLADLQSRISDDSIHQDPFLRGFRELHERVAASNRKHISSAENLMTYFLRTGQIPHINLIVDIYNLVSLETRLALGAHDQSKISGTVHLKLTSGNEHFLPLGAEERKQVRPGFYSYIDGMDNILCYLEVRQVEKTKVTLDTIDCFYIVQGNSSTPFSYIEAATDRVIDLTLKYCGGCVSPLATVT